MAKTLYAHTRLRWIEDGEQKNIEEGEKVTGVPDDELQTFIDAGSVQESPPLKGATVQDVLVAKDEEIAELKRRLVAAQDSKEQVVQDQAMAEDSQKAKGNKVGPDVPAGEPVPTVTHPPKDTSGSTSTTK
jgi:hypothetical protein